MVVVPFTYNIADYVPWTGTAGAAQVPFPGAVPATQEQDAVTKAAAADGDHARVVLEPQHLDLGDAAAVTGAFGEGHGPPPTPGKTRGKTTSCPYGHRAGLGRNLVPVSGYPLLGVATV